MKKIFLFLLLIPALCVGQMKREELTYNGLPYLKYTPKTMPINGAILFLHGIGERGSGSSADLKLIENNEIPKQMLTTEVPYVVIAPQLPANQTGWWENYTNPFVDLVKGLPGHKHLTGLSLGAMRVTVILAERPGIFNSASTVCGTNDVPVMGASFVSILNAELMRIPTAHWYDPLDTRIQGGNGYISIKAMCTALAGKADIVYRDVNLPGPDHHSIWPIAYQQSNFWIWLNSKVSPPKPDPIVSWSLINGVLVGTTQSGLTVNIQPQSIK